MRKIKMIEVKSELGAGTRGASLGPDALKIASLEEVFKKANSKAEKAQKIKNEKSFFAQFKRKEIKDSSLLLHHSPIRLKAKRIRGIVEIFQKLARSVQDELKAGSFPVILSGDHSSAGGSIAGVKMAYPDKKLGVIWVDAHADIHSPFTTPSGNVHGMPVAASLGIDNLDDAQNVLANDRTREYWNNLKNIGGISPKIYPQDLVYIGVRDMEEPEINFIRKKRIKVFTVKEVRAAKAKEVAKQVREYLKSCDIIYVSFDVDSLDSSIIKGTGTPVPNGFSLMEVRKLLEALCKDPRVVCFEITEINPLLDENNETARKVFPVFKGTVNTIKKRLEDEEKKRKKEEKKAKKVAKIIKKKVEPAGLTVSVKRGTPKSAVR